MNFLADNKTTQFLSAVTGEFGGFRTRLAERLEQTNIRVVYQEKFSYEEVDIIRKLFNEMRGYMNHRSVGADLGVLLKER